MGEPDAEPTFDVMLDRYRAIAGECVETYTGLAKRAVGALQGQDDSFLRDAWMSWADMAGKVVEASYLSAALADAMIRPKRDRA